MHLYITIITFATGIMEPSIVILPLILISVLGYALAVHGLFPTKRRGDQMTAWYGPRFVLRQDAKERLRLSMPITILGHAPTDRAEEVEANDSPLSSHSSLSELSSAASDSDDALDAEDDVFYDAPTSFVPRRVKGGHRKAASAILEPIIEEEDDPPSVSESSSSEDDDDDDSDDDDDFRPPRGPRHSWAHSRPRPSIPLEADVEALLGKAAAMAATHNAFLSQVQGERMERTARSRGHKRAKGGRRSKKTRAVEVMEVIEEE